MEVNVREHVIRKGLDLPIQGGSRDAVAEKPVRHVALVAADYVGMKPRFALQAGDTVKRGQVLFEDKKTPGVMHTAPGAGVILGVYRGERRALQSVVIELNARELSGDLTSDDYVSFSAYTGKAPANMTSDEARALLIESGLWTALRTRPFSRTPAPESRPHAIFVTACDSRPLAPPMDRVAEGRQAELDAGLQLVSLLTNGPVYFCKTRGSRMAPSKPTNRCRVEVFSGPHPAGTVGLHIHLLAPVSAKKSVWHVGLQDLLSMGALALTGRLDVTRLISFVGPAVRAPRLFRARLGAALDELSANELTPGENRVLSGSVLDGRAAMGDALGYLGRFHNQVCALREGREREFMGWLAPGGDRFSLSRLFLSKLYPSKTFSITTSMQGSPRAIVPIGLYEQVMPMDLLPTFLLRSLSAFDIEQAEKLGCLELDEEDLALCSFVDPGKTDFGALLRKNLELIEKEG